MDSNQQTNPTSPQAQNPTPTQQEPQVLAQQSVTPTPPDPTGGSNSGSKVIWVIVGLIILILAVGGVFIYMNKPATPKVQTNPPSTTQAASSLDGELNSLDVESEGNDFSEVDKDLQSL